METTLNNLTKTNPQPLLLHHHHHHHLRRHHHPSLPPPPPPPPRSIITTTTKSTFLTPISPKSPKYPSSSPHLRPSSGYAAAILDMAMRDGTADAVIKDMGRLGRVMRRRDIRDLMMMECGGVVGVGEVVKGVMRAMGVGRVVKGLVDLVVERGRGEVLGEIVVEFERILDELTGRRGYSFGT